MTTGNANKIAVITGATGGIGTQVCKYLVANGYTLYAATRNAGKSSQLLQTLAESFSAPDSLRDTADYINFIPLELNSRNSANEFCEAIIGKLQGKKIDLLINNAGMISPVLEITPDGHESIMQVNYLATREITSRLLPHISDNGRIINTVSCTINTANYRKALIECEKKEFIQPRRMGTIASLKRYSNAKLMLAIYTASLHRELGHNGSGIMVCAADPGIVNTGIITIHRWYDFLSNLLFRPLIKSPELGAKAIINAIEYNGSKVGQPYIFHSSNRVPISNRILKRD